MWKLLKAIWMEFVLHDQSSVTKGVLCMSRRTCMLSVIPRILNSAQYEVQVKVKFTLEQTAKAQRGSTDITVHFI
jgi:hypothetical protein